MNPTVEQTDILGDEQLAEIEQALDHADLPSPWHSRIGSLLRHAAALQAQLGATD